MEPTTAPPATKARPPLSILFIVPPHITYHDYLHPADNARHVLKPDGRAYGSLITDMPLGLLALSAYVKRYAARPVAIRLVDANLELNALAGFDHANFSDYFSRLLQEKLADFQPDIIGISALFSPSFYNLLELGAVCRRLVPQALILAGGSIPSVMYREIFQMSPHFDALCYGEGERPFLGLVEADDPQAFLAEHPSWITPAKLARNEAFQHDFIQELDEIPFYDYELCDLEKYGINPAITAYAAVGSPRNNFHVMTSRGCPFKCTFCASHRVHGRDMRYYSFARVEEDFTRLRDQYGASILVFQDDHFMGDKGRALAIVRLVKRLGMTAVFQNGLALYALEREMLEAIHDAGGDHLVLSVESGSERVLKELMKKPLKLSIVERVARQCRELGIYTNVNILIGMPGETKQDMADALAFLKTVPANWFIILCASPLVGSEMHDICTQNNYIKEGYIGCDFRRSVIETEDFSAEYVQETAYRMNLELNFVANSDMGLGAWETALRGFQNALRARHDHAFAHYFASRCLTRLGQGEAAEHHRREANRLREENPFWGRYFTHFHLPPL